MYMRRYPAVTETAAARMASAAAASSFESNRGQNMSGQAVDGRQTSNSGAPFHDVKIMNGRATGLWE